MSLCRNRRQKSFYYATPMKHNETCMRCYAIENAKIWWQSPGASQLKYRVAYSCNAHNNPTQSAALPACTPNSISAICICLLLSGIAYADITLRSLA